MASSLRLGSIGSQQMDGESGSSKPYTASRPTLHGPVELQKEHYYASVLELRLTQHCIPDQRSEGI